MASQCDSTVIGEPFNGDEHQSREQLKPGFHARLDSYGQPARVSGKIAIGAFGKVVDIVKSGISGEQTGHTEPTTSSVLDPPLSQ